MENLQLRVPVQLARQPFSELAEARRT